MSSWLLEERAETKNISNDVNNQTTDTKAKKKAKPTKQAPTRQLMKTTTTSTTAPTTHGRHGGHVELPAFPTVRFPDVVACPAAVAVCSGAVAVALILFLAAFHHGGKMHGVLSVHARDKHYVHELQKLQLHGVGKLEKNGQAGQGRGSDADSPDAGKSTGIFSAR